MRSSNPVFTRSPQFNGQQTQYAAQAAYSDPSTWSVGAPTAIEQTRPMTIDSVVQRTAAALGIVIAAAAITWVWIGDVTVTQGTVDQTAWGKLIMASAIGSLGAFALSMVNSFKRVVSPALVIAFSALEGVALGALSKFFDVQFGDGVVTGAVLGTFAAFAGTLAAYKFFDIKVGQKFRTFVIAAVFGMVGLSVLELVLSLFGAQIGLFGVSGLGMVTAVIGVVLGVFMLILDFDFVERGVAAGLPEVESWRAAFGLTVSLVWIYTNLLRILAMFSRD